MKVLLAIFALGLLAAANAADICDNVADGFLYASPESCNLFYMCAKQISEKHKCAFGLHFNPIKLYCQRPEVAGCKTSEILPDCKNLADGYTFEKPGDCDQFYLCESNKAIEKYCAHDLHYNAKKRYCEDPALAGCKSSGLPDCSKLPDGYTFEKPGFCDQFYLCEGGKAVEKYCAHDLHYNAKKKYCEDPALAGCDTTTPTPTPKPTPTATPTPTPKPTPTPTPTSCKGQPLGKKIPFVGDCTKYITCIGGGVVQDCPEPLHFNARLEVCDWPESAGCPWAF